jgi:hypothetical protein
MEAPSIPRRFPKIDSPFERHENDDGEYVVYDEWNVDPEWFKEKTYAIEKLDGTNCAVYIENGRVQDSFTRMGNKKMNYVHPYPEDTNHQRIVEAVRNSIDRGLFNSLHEDYHYGEVVGPKIQGNPHELDERLFVPFWYAFKHLRYKSWGEYGQSFEDLSDWFEGGLFSLFYARMHGTDLDTASVSNGTFCEGVMFTGCGAPRAYNWEDAGFPQAENFVKLRRDMFEWYEGTRH